MKCGNYWAHISVIAASLISAPAVAAPANALDMVAQARLAQDTQKLYRVQAQACRWGSATIDTAMFSEQSMWGRLAKLQDPAFTPNTANALSAETACDSEADKRARADAGLIYWRWLTRSAIFAQLVSEAGWGKDLVNLDFGTIKTLEPIRADVEKSLAGSFGQAAVQSEITNLQRESILVLNLLCDERRNKPVGAQRDCPAVPENLVDQRPMAKVRAEAVELFNASLRDAIAREQRGEYGNPYQYRETRDFFGNPNTDYVNSNGCDPDVYTVYPAARDTVVTGDVLDVSVHKLNTAGTFGRIKVKRNQYGNYEIVDGAALNIYSAALGPEFGVCFG